MWIVVVCTTVVDGNWLVSGSTRSAPRQQRMVAVLLGEPPAERVEIDQHDAVVPPLEQRRTEPQPLPRAGQQPLHGRRQCVEAAGAVVGDPQRQRSVTSG